MYLLDTAIVLALRSARADADPGLVAWASGVARERLFVSALSLVELEATAARVGKRDRGEGAALRGWIDERLLPAFDGHVLPIDTAVARRRGQLALTVTRDALIAACALEHSLTLVTFDRAAFKGARVKLFDPRGYRPEAIDEDADWRTAGRGGPAWLRNLFIRG
jgi:toxin FitB